MNDTAPARSGIGRTEFIALIAMLFATIALSIDAMLPAMPLIEATMSPDDPNRAKMIISVFMLGMGLGTFIAGPLSDAFGRKPVLLVGAGIYCAASLMCYFSGSLEWMLVGRFVQGIGASAPRAVSGALVRDKFVGREMAQIMSYAMMIFMLVPAIAPMLGELVMAFTDWHALFLIYMVFAVITIIWVGLRQEETLPKANRVPLSFKNLWSAACQMTKHRIVLVSILIQGLTTAAMISTISSIQGVFDQHFLRGETFAYWFCGIAILAGSGSILNAKIVMRLGMRKVLTNTYTTVFLLSLVHLVLVLSGVLRDTIWEFPVYLIWQVSIFAMMGLTMGNLNALAMEPLGRIAGFASSLIGALATVLGVVLAYPVGASFSGSILPLVLGLTIFLGLSRVLCAFLQK